jgi:hypothetical protein
MTSLRKIEANRKNALASTGPKSKEGKQRSARNAFRHGLAVPIGADLGASTEVANLAREIAGQNPTTEMLSAATRAAEAHLEIVRVRQTRRELISPALNHSEYWPLKQSSKLPSRKVMKLLSGPPSVKTRLHYCRPKPTRSERWIAMSAGLNLVESSRSATWRQRRFGLRALHQI